MEEEFKTPVITEPDLIHRHSIWGKQLANAYKFVKRHLMVNGMSTTVSIERLYWAAIDQLAEHTNTPAARILTIITSSQPAEFSTRAAWIRFCITAKYFKAFATARRAASSKPT